jgi:Holliday junction resolvase RusA-like endonuclease
VKTIEFHVDGIPKPQPRTKARGKIITGKQGEPVAVGSVYTPAVADDWKAMIVLFAREHVPAMPIRGPVELDCRVFMPRPEYMHAAKYPPGPLRHTGRGDPDNLGKCVMDILTQLGFYLDDKQVWKLIVEKLYAAKGLRPGMDVWLTWDDEAEAAIRQPKPRPAKQQPALFPTASSDDGHF